MESQRIFCQSQVKNAKILKSFIGNLNFYLKFEFLFQRWYDFESIMSDDQILHDALMQLLQWGLVFFKDIPQLPGQFQRLSDRLGYVYTTKKG